MGDRRGRWWSALAYLLTGLAALYTLYYAALFLVAHAAWAIVRLRKNLRYLASLGGVYLLMFLLYLPWLTYAVPQLVGYIGGKVQSDQDTPLGAGLSERHLVAFTTARYALPPLPPNGGCTGPGDHCHLRHYSRPGAGTDAAAAARTKARLISLERYAYSTPGAEVRCGFQGDCLVGGYRSLVDVGGGAVGGGLAD